MLKNYVYFLPVETAEQFASEHMDDDDWDIWTDFDAKLFGWLYGWHGPSF